MLIARTLKRYISGLADGDELSLAVFRKAFDEAQKHGLDTKALSNDIINRFLSDYRDRIRLTCARYFRIFSSRATDRIPVAEFRRSPERKELIRVSRSDCR